MAAGIVLDMEPNIVFLRVLKGQPVVLTVVSSGKNDKAVGGNKLYGRKGLFFDLLPDFAFINPDSASSLRISDNSAELFALDSSSKRCRYI